MSVLCRRFVFFLVCLLMAVEVQVHADDGPFNKAEFARANSRLDEVVATEDTTAILQFADSLWKSNNYRVHFLYYEAVKYYHIYAGHTSADIVKTYYDGRDEAKRQGKDGLYWAHYYWAIVNALEDDSSKSLDAAQEMLAEARNSGSILGLIRSYFVLSYIYYFRNENMLAVDMAKSAAEVAEEHKSEDSSIMSLLYDEVYMYLSVYYSNVPDSKNAFAILDLVEKYVLESKALSQEQKDIRMMDVISRRLELEFGEENYAEVSVLLDKLKAYPDYESYITSYDKVNTYFCILLLEGKEREALRLIDPYPDDMKHYFMYSYYKYKGNYKEAMKEWDFATLHRDSSTYQTRLSDMANTAAHTENVRLEEDKKRLQVRQQMFLLGGTAAVMLLIAGFILLLYLRNRKHTRMLSEKNVQLQEARDEAEIQRDEAQAQRIIAEEKRQEADEQRKLAEEKRQEADEHRKLAEEKRQEADEQRTLAEAKRKEADEQRAIAEEQKVAADIARKQAEQANEMKGHFIENMMHEIRTPLNAISGFSTLLTDPRAAEDPESMVQASDMINKNTQHLVHLLDDIIQIGNYESLSVDIDMQDTSICEVVLTSVMNAPMSAVGLQVTPFIDNLADDPQMFSCEDMLLRSIGCVLNNALKFTKEGSISIGADYNDEEVTFWVQDTGPGIPEGEEEHIFERFVKLDNFVPGTGLGLSLARAIVSALGGVVCLDRSYAERGSRFTITVPRNMQQLGTGKPKQAFQMEPLPEASAPVETPSIPEEDILAVLEEMQKENPDITRDDVIAMLTEGGMM